MRNGKDLFAKIQIKLLVFVAKLALDKGIEIFHLAGLDLLKSASLFKI